MKRVIGITGGVGSGKSRCLDILKEEYGARIILADLVAHELMEPGREGYEEVVGCLGEGILNGDGTINRKIMAEVIFRDDRKRSQINGIIHPLVWKWMEEAVKRAPEKLVVVEAALMDKEHSDIYDEMWYVYTSKENRRKRLKESRGYSEEKTENIMASQPSEEEFKALCSRVIDNNGSIEETRRQIAGLLETKEET